jgi:site-specific DNA recombinase
MATTRQETAGGRRPRFGGDVRISEDEWVKDEKSGKMRLSEKGITRQKEDILALADRLGVELSEWYPENDTSAFKKRRIRLPNGRSVWRVYRPEFRRMLADYEDGRIDGIIFYDIDRLARQPRDLEDLIDLVEYYKRPVETVTGNIDLRTSNGRAMARVLVAMANKSSEDTSRRVARARLQAAQEGNGALMRGGRRFGLHRDGTLNKPEVEVIRQAAKRFMAGESWYGLVRFFAASGIPPMYSRDWTGVSVRQILLSPSVAGIAVYNGSLREANQQGRRRNVYADPEGIALKDAGGQYIKGNWQPILTVEEWKALVAESEGRKKGQVFSARGTRKYLLAGLLRCGRIREDGSVCNRTLSGAVRRYRSGRVSCIYRCPAKMHGGCGGIERNMPKLDALIEDLLFAHIEANAPTDSQFAAEPEDNDPDAAELADVQQRLFNLRQGYAATPRTVSDNTMFTVVPQLEARERQLKADLRKKAKVRMGRLVRAKSPAEVRQEWDAAADDVGVRRAILSRYLKAVIVRPSRRRGPGRIDYDAIEPVWGEDGDVMPQDHVA